MSRIITKKPLTNESKKISEIQNLYETITNDNITGYLPAEFFVSDNQFELIDIVETVSSYNLTYNAQQISFNDYSIIFYVENEILYLSSIEFENILTIVEQYPKHFPITEEEKELTGIDGIKYSTYYLIHISKLNLFRELRNRLKNNIIIDVKNIDIINSRANIEYSSIKFKNEIYFTPKRNRAKIESILNNEFIYYEIDVNKALLLKVMDDFLNETPLENPRSVYNTIQDNGVLLYDDVTYHKILDIVNKTTGNIETFENIDLAIRKFVTLRYKYSLDPYMYSNNVYYEYEKSIDDILSEEECRNILQSQKKSSKEDLFELFTTTTIDGVEIDTNYLWRDKKTSFPFNLYDFQYYESFGLSRLTKYDRTNINIVNDKFEVTDKYIILPDNSVKKIEINESFDEYKQYIEKAFNKGYFLSDFGLYEYYKTGKTNSYEFPLWLESPRDTKDEKDLISFMSTI